MESQRHDPASTLAFVCALLRLRSREPTLQARTQRLVGASPDIFCFERQLDQRFLIALNYSSRSVPFGLRDGAGGDAVLELSTDPGRDLGPIDTQVLLPRPDEGVILRLLQDRH